MQRRASSSASRRVVPGFSRTSGPPPARTARERSTSATMVRRCERSGPMRAARALPSCARKRPRHSPCGRGRIGFAAQEAPERDRIAQLHPHVPSVDQHREGASQPAPDGPVLATGAAGSAIVPSAARAPSTGRPGPVPHPGSDRLAAHRSAPAAARARAGPAGCARTRPAARARGRLAPPYRATGDGAAAAAWRCAHSEWSMARSTALLRSST